MNCLKYGNKIYKPEILFDKIRKNPAFFAKKHNINGYDIEQVLGIPHKDISNTEYQYLKESDFDSDGNIKAEVLAEIKAEKERIISEAQANGTYMKAPNGQPTKLNKNQWVTVRTQRFKEWFGDWESASLINMTESTWGGNDKNWTYRFTPSKKLKSKFNELLGKEILSVGITDSAVRHIKKNHGKNEENRGQINKTPSDIAVLPYILNNFDIAKLSTPDRLGNPTIEFKKITNGVASVITVALGKNKEFIVTAWEEKSSASMKKSLMPNALDDLDLAKVQKDIENIKNSAKNVSKVVDENGEPLVVYHGSKNKFTEFDINQPIINGRGEGNGFYFASDISIAKKYAGRKGNIYSVFLNLRKNFKGFDALSREEKNIFLSTPNNEKAYNKLNIDGFIIGGQIIVRHPNQIKSATDNVGTFDSGNDDIRYQIIGEQGARSLDNIEQNTKRIDNLSTAKEMEANGKDSKSIWLATGWERGKDGRWRYEIPDLDISREKIYDKTGKPITVPTAKQWFEYHNKYNETLQPLYLKDFKPTEYEIDSAEFIGDELSKILDIYPELGEIRIIVHSKEKSIAEAFYSPKLKLISFREDNKSFYKDIIHEIQHAIQEIEGFASGANLANFKTSENPYEEYRKTAGEVEARNVQERFSMYPEERREKPLSSTEDVARREQTLRYSDGTQEANKQNKFIPPHQGVAPSSLLNAIKKKFEETNGNKAEAYKVLTQSHWYNELDTAEQNKITEKGIIDFLFDQVEKFKENKKAKTEWDKEQQLKADEQYRNDNLYNKSDEELLNDEYKAMEATDKKLRNKKPWISKEGVKKFITKVSDRQFNVKRIAMKLGMENTRNRIIAMAGTSAKSKREAEAVHNSIFRGLTFEEKKDLNLIITHRRNIAIDENREARGLPQIRHQRGHTKATSEKVLGAIKNRIGEKTFEELDKRASLYFDEFKKVLGSQLKAGLISQQQYDSMIDIDYQPRLFVEHLLDAEGNLMENSKEYQQNNKLGREMIKTLSDGSFGDQVIDAEWLFKMTIGARNNQLFMNDLNQTFATRDFPQAKREYDALMKKPKAQWTKEERNIAKYFEQLQSKVKFPTKKTEDTPKGYRKAYYYENGELKFFFMEEKFYDEWYDIQKGLFANPDVKEKVTKWSGSSLVKFFATGKNPAFVITNTPKDFAQIVMFSPEYSNNSVWATMQLAKDATKGVMELTKDDMGNKDTLLAKYIEYGGGMDFLHTQGLGERDNGVAKALEKVLPPKFRDRFLFGLNTISLLKLSRYSETMFRLGVFSRSMKNQLKEYNKVNGTNYKSVEEIPNETTKRDMYIGAVASARSVLDFNQGGTITKDMEAFVPYINAGVQGTRVAADAFVQRPKQTSIRLLQAGAFFGGIGAGMSALLFSFFDDDDEEDKRSAMEKILHAYDGLSEHQRINYFNIVLPEKLENGEYRVIKISKTQAITPLAYLMEEMLLNHFRKDKDKRGAKEILKGVGLAFNQNLTPIALPTGTKATDIGQAGANVIVRTPIIKAVVSATTGWDFFRNQPLDPLTAGKKLPMELEGIKNDKVEDFYKAFGEISQDSPVRVKAMVESFITSPDTNPFITSTYGILEGIAREGSFTDNFSEYFLDEKQGGILRRGLSETKDYNRTIRSKERTQEEVDRLIVKSEKEREKLKTLAEDYANGKIEKQDIKDAISEMTDNPKIREKYFNRVKDRVNKGDTDPMIWEIKYGTGNSDEAKAYLIKQHYGSYEEVNANKEIRSQLKENGVFSEAIQRELKKLGK